jgi:DNA-binding NarL/FixJ family response regulator
MNEFPIRVLVVDDEPRVLSSIRRYLLTICPDFEVITCADPSAAMTAFAFESFDLVLSDLKMPQFSGVAILRAARRTVPSALRVMFSGQASSERLFDALPLSHLYLEKPCSSEVLDRLVRILRLRDTSPLSPTLTGLVLSITGLPSDETITSTLTERAAEGASIAELDTIISSDLSLRIALVRMIAQTRPNCTFSSQMNPSLGELQPHVRALFENSPLVAPISLDATLVRLVRLCSLKTVLLERQLRGADVPSASLIATMAYTGELVLLGSVCSDQRSLGEFRSFRDDVTRLVGELWGLPGSLLELLSEPDLRSLRNDIDEIFPLSETESVTDDEFFEMYREALCSIL